MKRLIAILFLGALLVSGAAGQKYAPRVTHDAAVDYAKQALQGFSLRMWLSNQMAMGLQAWDAASGSQIPGEFQFGAEYPPGSGIEHLFGAGPWIGGIINGVRRVSEGFNGDSGGKWFRPDPRHPARERIWFTSTRNLDEPNRRGIDDDGDGKIDEDDLDGVDNDGDWKPATDDVGADGIPDAMESGCKGGYDAIANPDPAFDNFDTSAVDRCHPMANGSLRTKSDPDLYTERNGIPDHGEPHVDEDYAAVSESDFSLSATDTAAEQLHFPMGLKMIQKSYAWSGPAGEALIPMEYLVVNIGPNVIRDVYFTMMVDADVGPVNIPNYFQHNYMCYFDSLRLGFDQNPIDRGSTPLGVMFMGAPRPLSQLKMVFHWFNFVDATPGSTDSLLYGWMSGDFFPTQLIFPCQSPNAPADGRFLISCGPIDVFSPGDTLRYTIAFVSGNGVDEGPGNMKENAQRAIVMYHRAFNVPSAPPSPPLRLASTQSRVTLDWSSRSGERSPLDYIDLYDSTLQALPDTHWRRRDNPDPLGRGGRSFEGFKVWRSSAADFDSTSFVQIAQYDVIDSVGLGDQTGLRFSYVDTTVHPGRTYWYAVTSYSVPGVWGSPTPLSGDPFAVKTAPIESRLHENAVRLPLGFDPASSRDEVLVVPNPYRGDNKYPGGSGLPAFEAAFQGDNGIIWFIHLPAKAKIRVFSLVGDEIAIIDHDDARRAASGLALGQEEWRIVAAGGRPLAPGLFVFSVESDFGTQIGKFVILR
jgi:hypothetical protein